jgi:hypothetical protein
MPFFWIRRFHEAACSPDRSRLGRVVGGNEALEREVRRLLANWKVPSREPVVGESVNPSNIAAWVLTGVAVAAPLVVQSREPAVRRRRRR